MRSVESLERYRSMTRSERFQMALRMIDEESPYLLHGDVEQVKRKFELLRRQNERRNARMLAGIARTRECL